MTDTLSSSQPQNPAPDELVRGRYEAFATPSNFEGASRYDNPGLGRVAAGIDFENDDPADIEANTPAAPAEETYGNVDLSGATAYERAISAREDKKYDAMKSAYQKALAQGLDPQEARAQVAGGFGKSSRR